MTSFKALFIDRDGTILREPDDEQIDSLSKFQFVPGVIGALKSLSGLGYKMVMVSNQDGLGTSSFPYEDFIGPHKLMLDTLAGEGVQFDDELIDKSFPEDNAPTRKPRTGMFGAYSSCDFANSFVIGDRISDVELAVNLGAQAILLAEPASVEAELADKGLQCSLVSPSWVEIADFIRRGSRVAEITRTTGETSISVRVDLDGRLPSSVDTGLKFFDHMLEQIPHHSGISLQLEARGDLGTDEHHTMEDTAIALGQALLKALGERRGIERYGFVLPMDDCDAMVLIDLGGRIDFSWEVPFTREYVGDTPTEMYKHFFQSLCSAMQANMHIRARGENNHHLAEAVFKAFARALGQAVRGIPFNYDIPSSKGTL